MPDVHDLFPSIDLLSPAELHQRYNILKAELVTADRVENTAEGDAKLHEMVCILGALRRKSAGPPRSGAGGASKVKVEPSLEDL